MENKTRIFKAVIAVVLLAVFIVFILQNTQKVEIGFIFIRTKEIQLFVVLFATFAAGAFLGYLIGLLSTGSSSQNKKNVKEKE